MQFAEHMGFFEGSAAVDRAVRVSSGAILLPGSAPFLAHEIHDRCRQGTASEYHALGKSNLETSSQSA